MVETTARGRLVQIDEAARPPSVARRLIGTRLGRSLQEPVTLGAVIFLVIACVGAAAASEIAPHDPVQQDLRHRFFPPAWQPGGSVGFPLGTDYLGRDVLSRLLFGARISLALGFAATACAVAIGVTLGLLAALRGGWVGAVILRLVDAQLAFPFIVLAIATIAALGTDLVNLFVLLVVFGWAQFARVVRAEALVVMEQGYVEAARSVGVGEWRIAARYVLPNVAASVIVIAAYTVPQVIIIESALSFLGVGVQPPTPSWGSMLSEGQNYLDSAWWLATFAGLAIMLTVLAINLIGSALRTANDPRSAS